MDNYQELIENTMTLVKYKQPVIVAVDPTLKMLVYMFRAIITKSTLQIDGALFLYLSTVDNVRERFQNTKEVVK